MSSFKEDSFKQQIELLSREKRIDKEKLIEAVEEAIVTAAKKTFGERRVFEAEYNEETGQIDLYQYMRVVEEVEDPETEISLETARKIDPESEIDDDLGFQIFYREEDKDKAKEEIERFGDILNLKNKLHSFGRRAVTIAKKVIFSKIREAEGEIIYNRYKDRKGELVKGTVRRFGGGSVIVDIGNVEAILPREEQVPKESYRPGEKIQAVIVDVRKVGKDAQIILSRTNPLLIKRLFEVEVPEIAEGIVTIKNIARDPGERAKIAVVSNDPDVDPVGACVGMKGTRVQSIVQELRGEKIDIVPYSSDLITFVINSIAPAEVSRVLLDEEKKSIELIVPDDQLSLAIGKKGQNVRLATRLVDWSLEIFTESRIEEMKQKLREQLKQIEGVDDSLIDYLLKLGYHSLESLDDIDEDEVSMIPGFSREVVLKIKERAIEEKEKKQKEKEEQQAENKKRKE